MSGTQIASSSSTPVPVPVAGPSTPTLPAPPEPAYVPPKPPTPKHPPKPILKRPPPPPQPFLAFTRNILSISSKFLPPQQNAAGVQNGSLNSTADDPPKAPLKRAHFVVTHISTTYPISSQAPPSMPGLGDSIREIEEREYERRMKDCNEEALTLIRVEDLYKDCCRTRDETPLHGVISAIRQANTIAPRQLDLTGIRLLGHAAFALADTLAVEWGLRKLILKDCELDDFGLKPILHALLLNQSLPYLCLASNKRFKTSTFQLIGAYAQKSVSLEFLDVSEVSFDKKSVEYLVAALKSAPATYPNSSGSASPSLSPGFAPLSPSTPLMYESMTQKESYFNQHRRVQTPDGLPPSGFSTPAALSAIPSTETEATSDDTDNKEKLNGNLAIPTTSPPSTHPPMSPNPFDRSTSPMPSRYDRRRPRQASLVPTISVDITSLRLDECSLRGSSLESLAQAVRPSSLRHLSLRHNRIGPQGSVALALMIKDYPDSIPGAPGQPNLIPPGSPKSTASSFSTHSQTLPPPNSPPPTADPVRPRGSSLFSNSSVQSPPKPPPRHPLLNQSQSQQAAPSAQTTYTPYIPRSKRNMVIPQSQTPPLGGNGSSSASGSPKPDNIPLITSSRAGGVTTRHLPPSSSSVAARLQNAMNNSTALSRNEGHARLEGHSAALLDKVRSLDDLPRLGALQTLDLRGNDIRNGVNYLAQVLKRNRTLKVLNLSENRVDVNGLVVIADALKYNSTLETLDMSRNPCCGPGLEGITSVRTAFMINTSLKRLFLSSTNLTSPGAICLAEFLPEAKSLLHLDLTHNTLDIAGVMALSVGLKMNETIRCLDVNVPPNDGEFSRLSREILRWCVRNTERAVATGGPGVSSVVNSVGGSSSLGDALGLGISLTGGSRGGVWGLIERSELAKVVKEEVEKERLGEEKKQRGSVVGQEKLDVWKKTPAEVVRAARDCSEDLQLLIGGILPSSNGHKERLVERAQVLCTVINEMVLTEGEPEVLQDLLALNDELVELVKRIKKASEASLSIILPNEDPESPRVDYKGKGKAASQDELPAEDVQDLTLNDEIPHHDKDLSETVGSPVERSRMWVVEEAEVFRKGQALLGPNIGEEDAEVTSDELRLELLEAQVDRPRQRNIDEFGVEEDPNNEDPEARRSPRLPR